MERKALAVAAALALSTGAIAKPPFEIKGLTPGMTVEHVDAIHAELACSGGARLGRDGRELQCTFNPLAASTPTDMDRLADMPVKTWELRFFDKYLESIQVTLAERRDDDLVAALKAKFGPPKDKLVPHIAQFYEWTDGKNELRVTLVPIASAPTSVTLVSRAALARRHRAEQDEAARKAKDL
jgi:hypothetical protein